MEEDIQLNRIMTSLIYCMRMPKEDKKDKKRYIVLAWKLIAHFSLILKKQSIIKLEVRVKITNSLIMKDLQTVVLIELKKCNNNLKSIKCSTKILDNHSLNHRLAEVQRDKKDQIQNKEQLEIYYIHRIEFIEKD